MGKSVVNKKPGRGARRLPVASLQRWQAACGGVGAVGDATLYRQLVAAWNGRHRYYHSLVHLEACLRELDAAYSNMYDPDAVELALWFHDAIYRTYRRDNEERSAEWAQTVLTQLGANPEKAAKVADFILCTKHSAASLAGDAAFVVDIDLAILGESAEVYEAFEGNVRREYWWVSRKRYARRRAEILEGFLARPSIYHTEFFRKQYEGRARINLNRALLGVQRSLEG